MLAKTVAFAPYCIMAKHSDYEVTTFQRKPGLWRASIILIGARSITSHRLVESHLTTEDSISEKEAELAATELIRQMDDWVA